MDNATDITRWTDAMVDALLTGDYDPETLTLKQVCMVLTAKGIDYTARSWDAWLAAFPTTSKGLGGRDYEGEILSRQEGEGGCWWTA